MTITELIPTVQGLSHTEKLLLLQILVAEAIVDHYAQNTQWQELSTGDIVLSTLTNPQPTK